MSYNFGKTEAATSNSYLNPGIYKMKISEVEAGEFSAGKPYIGVKFETKEGLDFVEKFGFTSEKGAEVSMKRLQYLHEAFLNKSCSKSFNSLEDIAEYFNEVFTAKRIIKTIIVGGNDNGNNVFASLPFAGFVVPDGEDVEIGEFKIGSAEYIRYVLPQKKSASGTEGKKNGLIDDSEPNEIGTGKKEKEGTKSSKTTGGKATTEDKKDNEEVVTEDEPW